MRERTPRAAGDRLGRNLAHLVNTVQNLSARGVGLRVLAGQGAQIDTTTAAGRLVFGIFAALAEFERELIRERTVAGLKAARARGRKGGRKFALSKAQVRLAHRDTSVSELCSELGIRPVTLYRYIGPAGPVARAGREGPRLLNRKTATLGRHPLSAVPRRRSAAARAHDLAAGAGSRLASRRATFSRPPTRCCDARWGLARQKARVLLPERMAERLSAPMRDRLDAGRRRRRPSALASAPRQG